MTVNASQRGGSVVEGSVVGGSVLWPGADEPAPGTLRWSGASIDAVDPAGAEPGEGELVVDASNALVLPGIIDLHGDAFERSVMPRSNVWASLPLALEDNDAQLLAAGITTGYLSATDSWEPGLRSRETLRRLIGALDARPPGGPRVLLHVRHERCATDDHEELLGWIEDGSVHMLSFGDHTPGGIAKVGAISATQVGRSGVAADELDLLQDQAMERRSLGVSQEHELAEAARRAGCVTASHDGSSAEDLARDLGLSVDIAEFPMSIDLAGDYRAAGIKVLLGAPNLVRGGSHLGNMSVRDAISARAADILCSDYHYPSLFMAPFVLADLGLESFGRAWALVSETPAEVAGLDRGRLAPGADADVIVVERLGDGPPRVRAAIVGGELVYQRVPCAS